MTFIQILWRYYIRLTNPGCIIRSASLSRNVQFEQGVTIEYGSHVQADKIGKYTYINKYCLVEKNTIIGRFCSIAYNVKIGLGGHPIDWVSTHPFAYDKKYKFVNQNKNFHNEESKKTIIGNDVWVGANAIILAGVKIGNGVIIGANSLVTKDVDPYAIVYGNPAKMSRYRFDTNIIKGLQDLKWWDWDDEKLKKNIDQFDDPEKLLKMNRK